jgi:predicted heme/steroid binding protein
VEAEPGPEVAGENLTSEVEENVPEIMNLVQRIAVNGIDQNEQIDYLRGSELYNQQVKI